MGLPQHFRDNAFDLGWRIKRHKYVNILVEKIENPEPIFLIDSISITQNINSEIVYSVLKESLEKYCCEFANSIVSDVYKWLHHTPDLSNHF